MSFQITFSQSKTISGDTTFWYKRHSELLKSLDSKDFEKSTDEFNFRFRNSSQVIEITKDGTKYSGTLTNFIYHTKKSNKYKYKTISNTIILSAEQSENIYDSIQKSKILDLPTDNRIEDWKNGADGITYFIEHSDKENYWLKKYWTPSAQDSIPEALIVLDLENNLSNALNLDEAYSLFKNTLPRRGCYTSGGMTITCYSSSSLRLGYSGATKLPLGFYASYSTDYVGKAKIEASASLRYNFDNSGHQHLNFQTSKWNIFLNNEQFLDFLVYNYQNRILNIDDAKTKFENHQIKYGLNLKNHIGVGLGLDFISPEVNKVGVHLFADKWFSKPNISATLTTSLFDNQINYKAELFKSFYFNNTFLRKGISLGIAYEDFTNYKDLYFSLRMTL
ncbi:hypothetical protein [Sphingobacterium hungaricum]